MAATDDGTVTRLGRPLGSIVLAACALPGVLMPAHAEEAPERGVIQFKLSGYQEFQDRSGSSTAESDAVSSRARALAGRGTVSGASSSTGTGSSTGSTSTVSSASGGLSRIKVTSPALYALVPLGRQWSLEGGLTVDTVSGASPAYYTDPAGFASMTDRRRAGDLKLTRYFERQSVALGLARSVESDYTSNALSAEARFASDDQNVTWNIGLGSTRDTINPSNGVVSDARKRKNDALVGVTLALSPRDLVQLSYTRSLSSGYLDDPYKSWDHRPDSRQANVLLGRWNHWLGSSALRTGWRYYQDSFGIRAHTVDLGWALPYDSGLVLTPSVRYYTQSAARFFVPPDTTSATYPQPANTSGYYSIDPRLSAFGAITVGLKADLPLGPDWSLDGKFEFYRQDGAYRLGGRGTDGLVALNAVMWQVGVKRAF